jgi:hypothetical protein
MGGSARLALLVTLALAAGPLAGCGGDDVDSGSGRDHAELAIYDWNESLVEGFEPGLSTEESARELAELRPGRTVVRNGGSGLFFVLEGEPRVTEADVASASSEEVVGEEGIVLELTPEGRRRFEALTRTVIRSARVRARGGDRSGPPPAAEIAVVVDGVLLSKPAIDPAANPKGLDARAGLQIAGGLSADDADELAERLNP